MKNLHTPESPEAEAEVLPVHEGLCAYQEVDGQPGSLACTLGCSNMLQFANQVAQMDTSFAEESQPVPMTNSQFLAAHQFTTPPPNYTPQKSNNRQGVQDGGIQKKKHQRHKQNKQNKNQQVRMAHQGKGLVTYSGNGDFQADECSSLPMQLPPQQMLMQRPQQLHQVQQVQQKRQFQTAYVLPSSSQQAFVVGPSGSSVAVAGLPMPVTTQAGRGKTLFSQGK